MLYDENVNIFETIIFFSSFFAIMTIRKKLFSLAGGKTL